MENTVFGLVLLRGIATTMHLTGASKMADAINRTANAIEAGKIVDDDMAKISDLLKSGGTLRDWEAISNDINQESNEFLSR